MIKLENTEVMGWEHAIRGMRNPMNSWEKGDSFVCTDDTVTNEEIDRTCLGICPKKDACDIFDFGDHYIIGPNDHQLMMNLAHGGPVHAKYRRMITVYVDITAPLYWWKEFDTYKVGTVANSCSTMHKIHAKEFTLDDFSHEHLIKEFKAPWGAEEPMKVLKTIIDCLNDYRCEFLQTKNTAEKKEYWWQMIQLLPSSYNQKRTVMLNYEVLVNMYDSRKLHKLDEWREFCKWIEDLPYSELIVGEQDDGN